ncbi:MAG: tetratricopeptide repeat protein [Rhizobiaceae bacterium]|nr:tetratricopeptide repeat protein [Rhizobiaceae bacterium]
MATRSNVKTAANAAQNNAYAVTPDILDMVGSGKLDDAERIFGRSNLAVTLANAQSAAKLAGALSLTASQVRLLRVLADYCAMPRNSSERLQAQAEIELLTARPGNAIMSAKSCLKHNPQNIPALLTLAGSLRATGQMQAAVNTLETALKLEPDNAAIHTQMGETLLAIKRTDQAIAAFTKALSLDKADFTALFNLGNIHKSMGNLKKAVQAFTMTLKINPRHVEALNNRGASFQIMDRDREALKDFDTATSLERRHLFAWLNKGVSHFKLDQLKQSLTALEMAFAIDPSMPDIYHNYGLALMKMDRFAEAVRHFDAMMLLAPERKEGFLSKGNALHGMRSYGEAVKVFQQAIDKFPDYNDARINLAGALQELARHKEAMCVMDEAMEIQPDYPEAMWNKSNSMLAFGPSEDAWKAYENRLHISVGKPLADFGLPLLGNLAPDGKKLLVQWEQRFGDVIQMLRYVPALEGVCDCHWQVADSMIDLFKASFPDLKTCSLKECPPGLDARTPYTSLPLNLKNFSVETIPDRVPYLKASPQAVKKWQKRPGMEKRRMGITWRGNLKPPGRSIPIDQLAPFFEAFHSQLVSVQMDPSEQETQILGNYSIPSLGSEIKTFDESAGLLSNLDTVITIDTAVAHLAGALGRKTLILLKYGCDWRWMLERDDSPWYPTATLYRQTSVGDWADVIARASADIRSSAES